MAGASVPREHLPSEPHDAGKITRRSRSESGVAPWCRWCTAYSGDPGRHGQPQGEWAAPVLDDRSPSGTGWPV